MNGDYAWNYINKKIKNISPTKQKQKKKKEPGFSKSPVKIRAFNIMDAKQLLEFTKDRLAFLSSNHGDKLQLRNVDEDRSAIKDFDGHLNRSDIRQDHVVEVGDFNEIINDHIGDYFASSDDKYLNLMQSFLDDKNAL